MDPRKLCPMCKRPHDEPEDHCIDCQCEIERFKSIPYTWNE